ncbi:unnamed protein product [Rotaria sp. Silwood1]|nr:unnamed protein product [Rotaria sp. Silwood1]
MLRLSLATLVLVASYTVQGDTINIHPPPGELITIRPIPPIPIDICIFCSRFPGLLACNPCKYGQPMLSVNCTEGLRCQTAGGTCKYNQCGRPVCCPQEHRGCCPPILVSPIIFPPTRPCPRICTTDASCVAVNQKCCGSCPRCVNAVYT